MGLNKILLRKTLFKSFNILIKMSFEFQHYIIESKKILTVVKHIL